ncbi:helix-turn-helix transcriptional regulator [Planotetraspora mira]|uniref:Transcriptional regulator n=1 Tax=Planotetraspora mira TaxID=58121 RepID=A0A8J3XC49_9ACTN|nr:helix-turn-helix transcriptional regulator [Planotetraspora mira]GII31128.1 transcriptional regulator [Planotetraspora mira]
MDRSSLLGQFLRARRECTAIEDVGLTRAGRRRTPGLRREELAILAGVSTDYLVRLEQGRERRPSEQVLDALARALDLAPDAVDHLHQLARPRIRRRPISRIDHVSPGLLQLLGAWDKSPAFIMGRLMDVLATNAMTDALYAGLDQRDNLIRLTFLNPEAKVFFADWEKTAYFKVANLHASAGADPDDPFLPELVKEVSLRSEEFRRLWERHDVQPKTQESKLFHVHGIGDLLLNCETFTINSAPGQQLIIFQAEPGSPSERALELLNARRP